jgi:parallel beta-helix repeat protein
MNANNLKYGRLITKITVVELKKAILISFTIFFLLFALFLGCKTSVKASPNVIYVPTNYPTIQEAVNQAISGDTIFVRNGTYYEHVVIDKRVSLIGENRNSTIIDGEGTGNVIYIAANNVQISNFTIQNGGKGLYSSGIFIDHSSGNNISHNTIANSSNGICLAYSAGNNISDNTVSDNKYGISLYSSSNNDIYGNKATDNKYGVALYSSSNNRVHSNNVLPNMIMGIYLNSSNNNSISDNTISSNSYEGIRLDFSNNSAISGNTISNNDYGIRLSSSDNNLVSGNTVTNNYYGVYVHLLSNNNIIYHNNFNNTDQVWTDSMSAWSHHAEGNYWSDYTGQDINRDGIGDTPYVINAENQDNYPLMGKYSDFHIAWKGKTYQVTTICNSTISNFRFEVGRETGNRIMSFDVTSEDGKTGFCRVMIPTELMNYSYIVLVDEEEITPIILGVSNNTHAYLYFTYVYGEHEITMISSNLLRLYNELLNKHAKLQTDFHNLNSTYYEFLVNYGVHLSNYNQLLESFDRLNASYQQYLIDYDKIQRDYVSLLLEHTQNIQNLTYVFIAATSAFIIALVYLSTFGRRKVSET